ncbi:MAG: EFR1 family ferrodoxin [Lentisphaeria bacterium]
MGETTQFYWFSGTGNSLAVAKVLQERLAGNIELHRVSSCFDYEKGTPDGGKLGLFFPVYAWGIPAAVERFIDKLPGSGINFIFAVATYAAMPGAALGMVNTALERKRLHLNAAYGVKMPENYPPLGGVPGEKKKQRILNKADRQIEEIATDLNGEAPYQRHLPNPFFKLLGKVSGCVFKQILRKADRKFYADDNCDGCGVCANVCPVKDVELREGHPVWLGHCEQCFACLHWCPQEAVQYGRKSRNQSRYHHPAVDLQDFITTPASAQSK